jgi:hypothetical protein
MNEQLLKARTSFEEAQMAFDNEPDMEGAVDKLMDAFASILGWAEAIENQPPEIVDIPPPPVEPEPMPVPEADTGTPSTASALYREWQQQQQVRVQQGYVGAAYWQGLDPAWEFNDFPPVRTRVRPDGLVEAILPEPPSVRDTMDNAL